MRVTSIMEQFMSKYGQIKPDQAIELERRIFESCRV